MNSHNVAAIKAQYLQQQALALLPKDKENLQPGKRILNIEQWMVGDTEIIMMETDTVASTFLLAQKWPFALLDQKRKVIFAFMAGSDTMAGEKGKIKGEKTSVKSLLNLSLLFRTEPAEQPYIPMLAANSLLSSIKIELSKGGCELPLHIRWKHDILLDTMKVGEISLRHANVESKYYSQLNVEVNVKSIPRNFGAYDFQPTFLEKHIQEEISLTELAENVILNLAKDLSAEEGIENRKGQIKEEYENQLIYLKQKVTIYDKKFEHVHYTGNFLGVNEVGDALLEGFEKPFEDGVMKFNCEAKDYLSLYR